MSIRKKNMSNSKNRPFLRSVFEKARSDYFFENHRGLDTVAAHKTFTAAVGGGDGMEAIALRRLRVDTVLELGEVAGARSEEFFFQGHLQNDVLKVVIARGGGKSCAVGIVHGCSS